MSQEMVRTSEDPESPSAGWRAVYAEMGVSSQID